MPPILSDRRELVDRLFVHTHGVISRDLVSRHTPVDVTRPVHARNVRNARERRAVGSKRGSTVKWD